MMLKEGVFENPKVDAIFGLHVFPMEVGHVDYRPAGIMASSDNFYITVQGPADARRPALERRRSDRRGGADRHGHPDDDEPPDAT